jgi:hypothetical protein
VSSKIKEHKEGGEGPVWAVKEADDDDYDDAIKSQL